MTIAECLKNWDDESTLKWILSRGVSPYKWKAYALHEGVVDGRRWTYEEIAHNGKITVGKTRARISQIMKEVESALMRERTFSPHDSRCRRAVNNFLTWIRPERATSAYCLGSWGWLKPKSDTVFVCGEKVWRYCGESGCDVGRIFSPPLSMDLSWIPDKRSRPYYADPRYAVVWCTSKKEIEPNYYDMTYKSRYRLIVFNCDGDLYEFDHEESGSGGLTRIMLKPLECSVIRRF